MTLKIVRLAKLFKDFLLRTRTAYADSISMGIAQEISEPISIGIDASSVIPVKVEVLHRQLRSSHACFCPLYLFSMYRRFQ